MANKYHMVDSIQASIKAGKVSYVGQKSDEQAEFVKETKRKDAKESRGYLRARIEREKARRRLRLKARKGLPTGYDQ